MQDLLHTLSALPTEPARQTSDRSDAAELSDMVAQIAIDRRDNHGEYDRYRTLMDAANEIECLDAELNEARATVEKLRGEIRDLTDQLATYRVIETYDHE
jgi:polyhydroxyalkanoate synthesis regulator phasin